ncbi:MAG: cell division protein FtsX [Oscillospiraceae bacterium]
MKWSNFTYLMKQGLQSLWKNKLMSVASVAVLTICLVLIGGAVLLSINVNSMVGYVEQQNELVAFVKDDASEEQILAVQKQVQQMENVDSVVYTSKEEA